MADDDENVDLHEGMPVAMEDGTSLGRLAALLVAEEEEEAEFLIVQHQGAERLIPFEAVLGVGDGNLVIDVPSGEVMALFPQIQEGQDPTEAQMEMAYEVYDEHGSYAGGEEDED